MHLEEMQARASSAAMRETTTAQFSTLRVHLSILERLCIAASPARAPSRSTRAQHWRELRKMKRAQVGAIAGADEGT